jgi:carbon-monoxide dehydrogenase large subunit
LQGAGAATADVPSFPNGCHICEVEVDPDTGRSQLDRYTVVDDIGLVVNPLLACGRSAAVSRRALARRLARM